MGAKLFSADEGGTARLRDTCRSPAMNYDALRLVSALNEIEAFANLLADSVYALCNQSLRLTSRC